MTDFDYKKYSLEHLENWLNDCISSGEASPQEVYDVITKVVKEQYYYYKDGASKTYELLALLNGNGKGHIQAYDDYIYTDSKGNDLSDVDGVYMTQFYCDSNNSSEECKGAWNSFWEDTVDEYSVREQEYYEKEDKVVKWQLPVQVDDAAGDEEPIYYVNFPDDLLEAAGLKEGDSVEWVDNENRSYTLRKI